MILQFILSLLVHSVQHNTPYFFRFLMSKNSLNGGKKG